MNSDKDADTPSSADEDPDKGKDTSTGKSDAMGSDEDKGTSLGKTESTAPDESKETFTGKSGTLSTRKNDAEATTELKDKPSGAARDAPKELQKLFDKYMESADPKRLLGGLNLEYVKKWLKKAKIFDEECGFSESDCEKAFTKAAKGMECLRLLEFLECIENLASEKKKEPEKLFEMLIQAGVPSKS